MKTLRLPRSPGTGGDGLRSVSYLVGRGLAARAALLIERCAREAGSARIVIVHDRRLPPGPLHAFLRALDARRTGDPSARAAPAGRARTGAGRVRGRAPLRIVLRGGEGIKTREAKALLEDRLLSAGCGRDTLLVAIGGGSILDLAGFTAATYSRGIGWVGVPTTLLAMADASIGGKTAINVPAGKNLIGALHHPRAVICDLRWLDGLGQAALSDGFAEIIKISVARSRSLFERLEHSGKARLRPRSAGIVAILCEAARLKAAVVAADERDGGLRQVLNLGHTLAHAIEAEAARGGPPAGAMTHGKAVAIGLVFACRLAERANGFDPESTRRVTRVLAACGLPVELPPDFSARRLLARARSDKKSRAGRIRWVLPLKLGRIDPCGGAWSRPLDETLVLETLSRRGHRDTPNI